MICFLHGQRYEELFSTELGWIVFSCDIEVEGSEIRFLEVGIHPLEQNYLPVGAAAMLAIRREIFEFACAEGYTTFVLKAWRSGGANPKRHLLLRGRLEWR